MFHQELSFEWSGPALKFRWTVQHLRFLGLVKRAFGNENSCSLMIIAMHFLTAIQVSRVPENDGGFSLQSEVMCFSCDAAEEETP